MRGVKFKILLDIHLLLQYKYDINMISYLEGDVWK